jgi:hypothetical protein
VSFRRRLAAVAATAWLCLGESSLAAQARGTLDLGGSWVDYEGFLSSGAAFVTPSFRYDSPNASLGASGSLVVFESGNAILQGLAAGGWRTPPSGLVRGELSGSAGVHVAGRAVGGWIGGATGKSFFDQASATPYELELGGWATYRRLALGATISRTWFADTAYLDAAASARWKDRHLQVSGSLGFRVWSQGLGDGAYGELHATVPLWGRLVGVASGGRYPSDPVRGVIAANYVSVGLRVNVGPAAAASPALAASLAQEFEESESPFLGEARLTISSSEGEMRLIQVRAPGAASVALTGDFTDWQSVPMLPAGNDRWVVTWRITPGMHRVNVRIDGGTWIVPRGLRVEEDEFGGAVGILVVER